MTATEMQIAFPKVDSGSSALAVPPAPLTPANAGLATYASMSPEQMKKKLSCKDLLMGDTRTQAEQEAQEMLGKMLDNTQVFMTYGTSALEDVNSLVDRLLHEVEPVKIPELKELMKALNKRMRDVKHKYDPSDPNVVEKYKEWKGGIGRFFGQARTLVELLLEDVTSVDRQLEKVSGNLKDKQYNLLRNVSFYDQLYVENEQEIGKLIYKIAVMELIRDLAAQKAAAITVGDASLGDRGSEQRASITEFAHNMEIKIGEYKGRLMLAWATAPQVRTMRTLNVSLAERLNELICITIPSMKQAMVVWRMAAEGVEAAQFGSAVQEMSNEWFVAAATGMTTAVGIISETNETPGLSPATIFAMADELDKQADLEAVPVMANANAKVSDALLERVLGTATKPLEIATSVGT
jgi:uncharacterized protein YaaN involved in tellurite resistance